MANESNKTTEILEFKVEQGDAISEMEKLKRVMIGLKEDQKQLNDAYKKGTITQHEYAQELVRLENISKKTGATYNDLQKKVTGVQTETSKLTQALKDASGQIRIAGIGINDISSKITALTNPVTAAVAVVGALGAAYARSTIGAKDLAFAQAQLSAATTLVTNDLAALVSSAEDGEGALTKILNRTLEALGPAGANLALQSRSIVLAQEKLEDLLREELSIRADISERLSDNQELLTSLNDEQTTFEEKLMNISTIIGNLRTNQMELVAIQEEELAVINRQLAGDQENEKLQTAKLQKEKEIAKTKSDTEKRIQAVLRLEDNVREQNVKQAEAAREKARLLAFQTSELERQARIATLEREYADKRDPLTKLRDDVAEEGKITEDLVNIRNDAASAMADTAEILAKRVEAANKKQKDSADGVLRSQEASRDALRLFSSEAGRLYASINKDNKEFAAAQLVIDSAMTLSGITKNAAALGPVIGPLYFAAAVLSAGANLKQAADLIGADSGFSPTTDFGSFNNFQGQLYTASDGTQYAVGNKGEVIPVKRGSIIVTNKKGDTFDASAGNLQSAGYRLTHPFLGLRKALSKLFAEGGYTGTGGKYQPAGVVHAGEVVWSQRDVAAVGGPAVANAMRPTYKGYADGGLVRPHVIGPSYEEVLQIARNMPVFISWKEYLDYTSQMGRKGFFIER